jgi:hypothetical protein
LSDPKSKYSIHYKTKQGLLDMGFVVTDYVCWNNMLEILRSTQTTSRIITQVKNKDVLALFRKNRYNVQSIGNLTIE